MVENVKYYWTWVQASPSCQNHSICDAHHSTLYQNVASKTQRTQVGNGQCVSVLFIVPVITDVHGHRFEIYTLVSEIHKNVDLVLGIKNVFKLKGLINSRDCCFKFLNRSVPIFPEKEIILKPKEQKLIKVKAPFIDEISGMAINQNSINKVKIHMEQGRIRYSKQRKRYHDILARRNDRSYRFEIIGMETIKLNKGYYQKT